MKTVADPIEQALDDALDMTFPASDPIAVFVPAVLPEGKHPFVIRRLGAHRVASSEAKGSPASSLRSFVQASIEIQSEGSTK